MDLRVSCQALSFTNPLWAKHFWQMSAYLEEGDPVASSSPRIASANLSYHCFLGGGWGVAGTAMDVLVSRVQQTPTQKRTRKGGPQDDRSRSALWLGLALPLVGLTLGSLNGGLRNGLPSW